MLELAGEVQSFWEARSRQTGLALSVEHDPNLPWVKGDAHRLRRLCDNLIENAIKHTPRGGQVLLVLRSAANSTRLRLEVRDSGVGISPEHLPNIFERFYRVDQPGQNGQDCTDAFTKEGSGSGLGLAIARSIVQGHGGEIGVESALGKGSTFWVMLPAWG
jgi:signal transduction histidine kinase